MTYIPSAVTLPIKRSDLEYPTEDVYFVYLTLIEKVIDWNFLPYGNMLRTVDSFTDKAIQARIRAADYDAPNVVHRRYDSYNYYYIHFYVSNASKDLILVKHRAGFDTEIGSYGQDLQLNRVYITRYSISGSSHEVYLTELQSTPCISVTDSDIASGFIAVNTFVEAAPVCEGMTARLLAPSSPLLPALAIIEAEITGNGTKEDPFRPVLAQDIDTIRNIDKLVVTWGAFDHKPEHNTMLITITDGNPYTGEKAIQEQIEYAKSKTLKVLTPPKDYNEAIEQYRQLKQEFTEWIAGKDNYAYQTLGHEDFEKLQVADTYYGNIIEGIKPNAYKNVPDWEMRRTLAMWKERLKRVEVVKTEAEKHLKKLEEVEKKGW